MEAVQPSPQMELTRLYRVWSPEAEVVRPKLQTNLELLQLAHVHAKRE